ncbi:MAG: GIY-YIG nuclease family protein [Beijerinckiaceae bacterium]|nr:GIY-YIG nuclease family protein [Beijerinckiaceae bacterium]
MSESDRFEPEGLAHFEGAVDQMEALLQALTSAPCHRVADHPTVPRVPGIYLFRHEGKPIYVGQSRDLRRRLRYHTRPSSRHNQASFAFNFAKREAFAAGLDVKRTRSTLAADVDFAAHFADALASVAGMSVQFTEIEDPIVRTMFEMYASLALGTSEFNSFETH